MGDMLRDGDYEGICSKCGRIVDPTEENDGLDERHTCESWRLLPRTPANEPPPGEGCPDCPQCSGHAPSDERQPRQSGGPYRDPVVLVDTPFRADLALWREAAARPPVVFADEVETEARALTRAIAQGPCPWHLQPHEAVELGDLVRASLTRTVASERAQREAAEARLAEVDTLRAFHRAFHVGTSKRAEALLAERDAALVKAAQYVRDWQAAKSEYGTAMSACRREMHAANARADKSEAELAALQADARAYKAAVEAQREVDRYRLVDPVPEHEEETWAAEERTAAASAALAARLVAG